MIRVMIHYRRIILTPTAKICSEDTAEDACKVAMRALDDPRVTVVQIFPPDLME